MIGFLEMPVSYNMELILAVGEDAIFTCQHCTADTVHWRLNGTLFRNSNVSEGVIRNYTIQSYCGVLYTLTIVKEVVERYNQTTIQCEAEINGSPNVTSPVLLLVQGIHSC